MASTAADTFCLSQNQYQEIDKRYPDTCSRDYQSKTLQDVMAQYKKVVSLQSLLAAHPVTNDGGWYDISGADVKQTLNQAVHDFCCTYKAKKELQTRAERVKTEFSTAKHRADVTRDPAADINDNGTTFPFGRPLRTSSVLFLLIAIALFTILSLALLLDLGNVQLLYRSSANVGAPSMLSRFIDSFRQSSWLFLITLVAISGGIATGIYFAIAKTHPEWLGLK